MGRGSFLGFAMIGTLAAGQALAIAPHAALASKPVAAFTQLGGKKGVTKALYYKNEDLVKTTTVTVKTPNYTAVQTPIKNSKGVITGYTTTQKITSYTSVTTKSTAITPKTELFTTNGTTTAPAATAVKFSLDVPSGAFAGALSAPQDAMFSFSALSTSAPVLSSGGLFTQMFDSGTLSFTRTTPLYKLDALGHATGAALTNLLTVTFHNAILTMSAGGATMGFSASTPDSTLNFASDFRQFTKADWLNNFDFALVGSGASAGAARASVDPALTNVTGTRSLNSFRVSTSGTFAASDVPEPASWALMLVGFGAIGVATRGARKPVRIAD